MCCKAATGDNTGSQYTTLNNDEIYTHTIHKKFQELRCPIENAQIFSNLGGLFYKMYKRHAVYTYVSHNLKTQ